MGNAFECDACGELCRGYPTASFNVNARGRLTEDGIILGKSTASWGRIDTNPEFCDSCARYVTSVVDEAMSELEGSDDE